MKQSDAKRLLAYSSIGQIGYIVLAIGRGPLPAGRRRTRPSGPWPSSPSIGALFHVLNHAIFKGLLFLTSGSILYATGTKDLNKLGGLIQPDARERRRRRDRLAVDLRHAALQRLREQVDDHLELAPGRGRRRFALVLFGIVALFTSAVTLACYVKFFGMAFTSAGSEWNVGQTIREVPASMLAPKIVLTAVCPRPGALPGPLRSGSSWPPSRRSEGFLLADGSRRPGDPMSARSSASG